MDDRQELPGRMELERRLACPHCGKMLPKFSRQEIVERDEYPLRCAECRRVVELPQAYLDRLNPG